MIGIKMGREGIVPEWVGAWLASFFLLPLGFFLLKKAASESAIFDKDKYQKVLDRLNRYIKSKQGH